MTTYSPLDNIKLAEEFLAKMRHEEADLRSQIEYEQDTGRYEVDERDYKFLEILNDIIQVVSRYVRDNHHGELP